nr:olfactory receptor 4D9-like [Nothobranchius furzeri]
MNSAIISLLLKPGKDPAFPTSYRPISLINVYLKIICKALAKRLEKVTPFIIHPDQTGFIKGRQSSTNSRRLLNLIDFSYSRNIETSILSLDAEKAFDRVNWKFLFATLHKFGFGNFFINWLQTLYSSPAARVRTNNQISAICVNRTLHEPMYMFLCSLFVNELYGSTGLFPFLLIQLLSDVHTISAPLYFLQVCGLHTYLTVEFNNLAIMSYDRYLSICHPLQYNTLMTVKKVAVLVAAAWLGAFLVVLSVISMSFSLQLFGNVWFAVYPNFLTKAEFS